MCNLFANQTATDVVTYSICIGFHFCSKCCIQLKYHFWMNIITPIEMTTIKHCHNKSLSIKIIIINQTAAIVTEYLIELLTINRITL